MSEIVRIQVPFDIDIYKKLERRARDYGFDSVQAYIRVWAKAEVDGRKLLFEEPVLGEMSRAALIIIANLFQEHLRDCWNHQATNFKSIEDALKYVHDYYEKQLVAAENHQLAQDTEWEG